MRCDTEPDFDYLPITRKFIERNKTFVLRKIQEANTKEPTGILYRMET